MAEEQAEGGAYVWTSLEREDSGAFVKSAGRARVEYANGDNYEGGFNEARQKHGRGVYTWSAREGAHPWVPEGGYPEGKAPPVVRYEGSYAEGRKAGVGKLSLPNGDRYHGSFERDRFHGQGSYFYAGGDVYSGAWVRGVRQGHGTLLVAADESQLTGQWLDGALTTGKWIWKDGTVWLGPFRDGRPLGAGVFYFPNGSMQEGVYATVPAAAGGDAAAAEGDEGGDAAAAGVERVWKGDPFMPANMPASQVIRAPLAVA